VLVTRALALGLACAVALGGCGDDSCRKIAEVFVLQSPDSDLQALVDDCVANSVCLPLCKRVVEIGGEVPGMASILRCYFDPPLPNVSAGPYAFGSVWVTYWPSSCSR